MAEERGAAGAGGGREVAREAVETTPGEQGEGGGFEALDGPAELFAGQDFDRWVPRRQVCADAPYELAVRGAAAAEDDAVWQAAQVEAIIEGKRAGGVLGKGGQNVLGR